MARQAPVLLLAVVASTVAGLDKPVPVGVAVGAGPGRAARLRRAVPPPLGTRLLGRRPLLDVGGAITTAWLIALGRTGAAREVRHAAPVKVRVVIPKPAPILAGQAPASPRGGPVADAVDGHAVVEIGLTATADVALAASGSGVSSVVTVAIPDVVGAPTPWQGLARRAAPTALRRSRTAAQATVVPLRRSDADQAARPVGRPPVLIENMAVDGLLRAVRQPNPALRPNAADAVAPVAVASDRRLSCAQGRAIRADALRRADLAPVKTLGAKAAKRPFDSPDARSEPSRLPDVLVAVAAAGPSAGPLIIIAGPNPVSIFSDTQSEIDLLRPRIKLEHSLARLTQSKQRQLTLKK